jgi:hypothetical protein
MPHNLWQLGQGFRRSHPSRKARLWVEPAEFGQRLCLQINAANQAAGLAI